MAQPERDDSSRNQFAQASSDKRTGVVGEFIHFLGSNKKWWMTPIIVIFLVLALLIVLAGTGAAPFIYTLF